MGKIDENRRKRFERLAAARTNAVLKKIKVLGNCANRQAYEYRDEDIDRIFSTIEKYLKSIKSKFHDPKDEKFKL